MKRRTMAFLGAIECVAALTVLLQACGAFHGQDGAAGPDDGPDSSSDPDDANMSTMPDSTPQGMDAAKGRCQGFDPASETPPASGLCEGGAPIGTDSNNCGVCGRACGVGVPCVNGTCEAATVTVLQFAGAFPLGRSSAGLFVRDQFTVYTEGDGGWPRVADPKAALFAAVASDRIWMRLDTAIESAQLDGSIATFAPAQGSPGLLAITPTHLIASAPADGKLTVFFTDGGVSKVVSNPGSRMFDVAVTPDNTLFFVERTADAGPPPVDGGPPARGRLNRYDLMTGTQSVVTDFDAVNYVPVLGNISQSVVAADRDFIYFATQTDGAIKRLPVDAQPSTQPVTLVPGKPGQQIGAVATDGRRVYYTSSSSSSSDPYQAGGYWDILSVNGCGGPPRFELAVTTTARAPGHFAAGLAVDGDYLYWGSDYTVYRVRK